MIYSSATGNKTSPSSQTLQSRALLLGTVAGMRSQLPLALLGLAARRGGFARDSTGTLSWLRDPRAQAALGLSAVGELLGDKLPQTPSRLFAPALLGRLVIGAVAGVALYAEAGESPLEGAAFGAFGAALGSFGGYYARLGLSRATETSDLRWAVLEDGLVLGLGVLALQDKLLD